DVEQVPVPRGQLPCDLIDPALNKSLYELIPKNDRYPEDQENGVALFATTQSLSNFGGAVLGAVTIGVMGMSQILLMACLFYFTASRFSKKAVFFSSTIDSPSKGDSGWEFLKRFGLLKKMVIGFGVVNFFTVPTLVILPLYTKKILGADSITLGALEGALWVGLFAGALGSRWVPESVDKLVIAGVCLLVLGITFCIPAFAVQSVLYGTMLFVSGLVLGVNNVKFLSLFQQVVPAEVKGRFFALLQYLIGASFPLGYFVFGWLCDLMSVRQTCLVQGMGVLLVSHYFWFLRRRISTGELSWESK
ncbi:MAG: hypothetical protein EB078_09625, partial [Proteobacteria bacterium]|nr:hypothetical protein [Pseudomonadota bacterium]NDD05156.1 hypothetical protein [Pseudomonadota bacterium]